MVLSIIASVVSTVVSTVSSIGSGVSSFCASVLPKIVPALDQIGAVIKSIANIVFKVLDIFQPDDDVEDMGDRALQAAEQGIKPDNFDTYDEYIAEIKNFKPDPDKSATLSSAEKIGAGLAVGTTGMEKKFDAPAGSLAPIWVLAASNPTYFNADRLVGIVQSGHSVTDVMRYFEGKLGPADAVNTRDILMGMERQRTPEKTDTAIYAELTTARDTVENFDRHA